MNRPLSDQERQWLELVLGTLPKGEYFGGGQWINEKTSELKPLDEPKDASRWLAQIPSLRVSGRCECGDPNCKTIKFAREGRGPKVGIATVSDGEGHMLIALIDETTGELAELEVVFIPKQ